MKPPDAATSRSVAEVRLPYPAPFKGRGTSWAIASHLDRHTVEAFDDGWGTLDQQASKQTLAPSTDIIEERAKTSSPATRRPTFRSSSRSTWAPPPTPTSRASAGSASRAG